MKKNDAQKNFQKEIEELQGGKKNKRKNRNDNIQYFNKKTYRDRLNEYFQKWFVYVLLPKMIPIIVLVVILLFIISYM
ncbi:hypothetical protein HZI73_06700 [Vallitalea pronyensis]|uniref:Uncharacterized protein n=1 Tax=Vallitalea pronyensis TaxID=1348613 RepID=A0A8J8MI35_9FIRM|nr:hypothetical protein [Vallitalea pronyensis]QUI22009.1 hypothetical protein HZI73_06700 [Vallitalea pronyensis]